MMGHPPSHSTTIYLVRHGQSLLNLEKRVSGQLDPLLSTEGMRHSVALADQLRKVRLTRIYTSALKRTIETARPTAESHGLPIRSITALNELHFGVLEGRFRDARDPEASAIWKAHKQDTLHYRIPGGESFAALAARVTASLKDILADAEGGTILLVGHRNTHRALFGMLTQQPEAQWPEVDLKSNRLYQITTGNPPQVAIMHLIAQPDHGVMLGFRG